jgi:hypothetical protein
MKVCSEISRGLKVLKGNFNATKNDATEQKLNLNFKFDLNKI